MTEHIQHTLIDAFDLQVRATLDRYGRLLRVDVWWGHDGEKWMHHRGATAREFWDARAEKSGVES